MADFTGNVIRDSKKLLLYVKENEGRFISGELDLNCTLKQTDELYHKAFQSSENVSAAGVFQDSSLLSIQTKITRECARSYQVDTLVFDPRTFCTKVKNLLSPNDGGSTNVSKQEALPKLWEKLGEYSKAKMNTVPIFNFIYGTFDAEPVEPVKKLRKKYIKDKVGDVTKPEAVNPKALNSEQTMLIDTERIFSIFMRLIVKSKDKVICFYEFVTDPNSFTRTVENMFLVSLLVKSGYMCLFPDQNGLPCLKTVPESEKSSWDCQTMQSVLSITMDDWQKIVDTFNFKTALLPPRRNRTAATDAN